MVQYELASGQVINIDKSEVSFGRNVPDNVKDMLLGRLSFKAVETHEKYLGLPTYIGRSKKVVFGSISDRVLKKLKGWKEKALSKAGKEVLLKAVVHAIPTYVMQCFDVPSGVCDKIEGLCRRFWWANDVEKKGVCWVNWEVACEVKYVGGLGFRKFKAFNKALLAKQSWRILQNPLSLVAGLLKARYHPRTNFWEASVGFQPSYTWRSIVGARNLVEKGVYWRIGNGRSVRIWKDKWLPKTNGHMVLSPPKFLDEMATVAELINTEGSCWRQDLLNLCFDQYHIQHILSIPVSMNQNNDDIIWGQTDNGRFSVKSAYRLAMDMDLETRQGRKGESSRKADGSWKLVWTAMTAPKVKHHFWHVCRDALPSCVNLIKRGLEVDPVCQRYGNGFENLNHLLLDCEMSKTIWKLSPFRVNTADRQTSNAGEWCLKMIEALQSEDRGLFMSIPWAIWKSRNKWVFEKKKILPWEVVSLATDFTRSYEVAQEKPTQSRDTAAETTRNLSPPNGSTIKMNVDATVCEDKSGGFGAVLRNSNGEVIASGYHFVKRAWSIAEMEAGVVRWGLKLAKNFQVLNIIVESDAKLVVGALSKTNDYRTHFGRLIDDCLAETKNFISCSVAYTHRSCNRVALELARLAATTRCTQVFHGSCPDYLVSHVANDMSQFNA